MLSDSLATLDKETLEAPESRVKSVAGARDRIKELKDGDALRARRRARVQALIDGAEPYDVEAMESAGRGDDANINFREAEGMVAAATTPYYELDFGVPRAVNIELVFGDNKQKSYEWSEALADAYSKTLWGWKGYKINRQLSHYQMSVFGRGPVLWSSKRGWYFAAKRDDSVWVADNALCDLDLVDEMAIAGHFQPTELYKKINKKEVSKDSGWNIEMAKKAIIKAAPKTLRDTYHDSWSQYEASLRRGDVQWQNKSARIYYTDYFVKEFDQKITHCIVLDTTPGMDDEERIDDFVFKKVGRFESFSQIIDPFFFDVGPDGHWWSVKGYGPKIFDFCDLSNRINCSLINCAVASAGLPLQAQNNQALQRIQQTPITRAMGMTFLPEPKDWAIPTNQWRVDFSGAMQVKRELQMTLQANTGQYRQRVSEENQEPTLGQAQLNVQQQATLTRGAYDRYYHYLDDMHYEILRRMLDSNLSEKDDGGKEALEMLERLIEEYEVPKEALKIENIRKVEAVRGVGYGSPQMQEVINGKILQMAGTMDAEGKQNAYRAVGANMVGQSNVGRFWKKFSELGIPNDQEAMATLEDNMFPQTEYVKVKVSPGQNHEIHFTDHYQINVQHLQMLQQGQGDPQAMLRRLVNSGVNMHEHLQEMQGDPTLKEKIKQFTKMLMQQGKLTDQLKKQLEKQQGQKNGQKPQIDPKMIEGLLKLQMDNKLKTTKLVMDESRKDKKLEADMQRKDKTTGANIMRRNAEAFSR